MDLVREMNVFLIPQHTWVASMASKVQPRSSRAACDPRESESSGSLPPAGNTCPQNLNMVFKRRCRFNRSRATPNVAWPWRRWAFMFGDARQRIVDWKAWERMVEDSDVTRRRLGVREVRASGLGFALALARACPTGRVS